MNRSAFTHKPRALRLPTKQLNAQSTGLATPQIVHAMELVVGFEHNLVKNDIRHGRIIFSLPEPFADCGLGNYDISVGDAAASSVVVRPALPYATHP
jgi:hypothetical protein